ncbi:MAG: hypothetical protein JO010_06810, partial [Alphaproteobacteria bacterium]|nr:hypothetical protein [Alphaproteobacteria bacterium]
VRDGIKTFTQVDDAAELARTTIARAIVWTRVSTGFESQAAKHVRLEVERQGLPTFSAALIERAAYREIHITGKAPRQIEQQGKAASNVTAITAELLDRLAQLQEAAQ